MKTFKKKGLGRGLTALFGDQKEDIKIKSPYEIVDKVKKIK